MKRYYIVNVNGERHHLQELDAEQIHIISILIRAAKKNLPIEICEVTKDGDNMVRSWDMKEK